MEKIMIYPYSKDYEPYVKHSNFLTDGVIVSIVSPRGWGLVNNTVECGEKYLTISDQFINSLVECTTVWFVDDGRYALPTNILLEKVSLAIKNNKKVVFTRYNDSKADFLKIHELIPEELNITPCKIGVGDLYPMKVTYSINTPTLVVLGAEKGTDKFEVQMQLIDQFERKGYKCSAVSSRRDSELYGMHSIPDFMFDGNLRESDKVIQYNHYVKLIESIEKPDLIIIGIPGGILPYDGIYHNDFGILAYEISMAIPCDAAIMCFPYNQYFSGDYSDIIHDVDIRFGFNILGCHIAAVVPDTQDIYENLKRNLITIEKQIVRKKIESYHNEIVIDMTSKRGAEKACELIIDFL
ncbi:TIGR04066 family peptide maturation system protein [Blautia schinkii]|nr:TIGR04066 family peptide maturation system protein [Blautia schinkii]